MTDWNQRFMDLAHHVAGWSKDPSTQVGAVIVNDKKQVLSLGYNGFPRGVFDCKERYDDRPTKLKFVAHAERNALDNAYVDVDGATLYSTLYPCSECAKGIIQRGVKRVVTSKQWYEQQATRFNFDVSETMFKEADVEVLLI
jgi:dCMP deaminase